MRSHMQIVTDFGASKLAHALRDLGRDIAVNTPQRWGERDRIPMDWWADLEALGASTFAELKEGARPRKRPAAAPTANSEAA